MIRIATAHISPRLKYTADFVFTTWLRMPYRLDEVGSDATPDPTAVFYGRAAGAAHGKWGICLPESGVLGQSGVAPLDVNWTEWNKLPVMFAKNGGDLPFDLFTAVFFCLSRYEEYGSAERDAHGRFLSAASVMKPWLERPLVDEWLLEFEKVLIHRGLLEKPATRQLRWVNTIDIDIAYAYRGRSLLRGLGAFGKDLLSGKWNRIIERAKVLSGVCADPYDTYEWIRNSSKPARETLFFVLCGKRGGFDINLEAKSSTMSKLLASLEGWSVVGIHPSYASHSDAKILHAEVALLSEVLHHSVENSRQHFLKFDLPETYRRLSAAGIKRDYSMGYADAVGFRSGTACPHLFYDLLAEETTQLELHPLIAMDSAMLHYMKLSPKAALTKLQQLWDNASPTGGNFVTVWHNHSLSERDEWVGWREVFRVFVKGRSQQSEQF